MEFFLKTADDVAHSLSERYKEQWVDPKDDRNKLTQTEEWASWNFSTKISMRNKDYLF